MASSRTTNSRALRRTVCGIETIDPSGLFESSADLVCVCRRGRMIYLNPAGRVYLGAPADAVANGAPLESLVHRSSRPEVRALVSELPDTPGSRLNRTLRIKRRDGTPWEAEWILIRLGRPAAGNVVIEARDRTSRGLTERALQESEELFRQMAATIPDVFWMAKADFSRMLYVSPAYEDLWGLPVDGLMKDPLQWFPQVLPEDRKAVESVLGRLATGRDSYVETRFRISHPSRGIRMLLVRCFKQVGSEGGAERVVGITRDITERDRMERALRESEERFELALRGANDGIWDWYIPENRVWYSTRWKTMLGHTDAEIGPNFEEWRSRVHPDDLPRALQLIDDYFANRVPHFILEHRLRHKDGSYRWILSRGHLLRDADGKPHRIAGSHVDITEQRELERQILEVAEAERRGIGLDLHDDLGQRLTALEMMSQFLADDLQRRDPAGASTARGISAQIREAVARVRQLSRGLAPMTLEPGDLPDALRDLMQTAGAASGVRCRCEIRTRLVLRDSSVATHLYRVAQEAVNNALKHGRPRTVTVRLSSRAGALRLLIEDDGCGLPKGPGAGPQHGIPMMRYRAQLLGGTLEVSKRPRGGVRVLCSLQRKP